MSEMLIAAALFVLASSPAYAYLDAGTGSIMIQAIFGAVASVMLFGRAYLAKVKAMFSRQRPSNSNDAD